MEARHVVVRCNADLLTAVLTAGSRLRECVVVEGLPPGAKLLRVQMNMQRDRVDMVFEHELFEIVPYGRQMPELQVTNRYAS